MKFTYIICYRHNNERYNNLIKTVKYMRSLFDFEMVLVEQDDTQKLLDTSIFDKYIFTYSNRPFNRSWAFNVGIKYSSSDVIFFGDCDLICPKEQIDECVDKIRNGGIDCVSPYNMVNDLTKKESRKVDIGKFKKINKIGRRGVNLTGGIVAFSKESIIKIAGWCEDFEGWGGEDDFQTWKVNNWLSSEEVSGSVYHLYHERAQLTEAYSKNIGILQSLGKTSPEDIIKWIDGSRNIIGNENKYMNKEQALNNLIEMTNILTKNNVLNWLTDGTLLGAHREGDFISHDTDTDLGVTFGSLNKESINEILNNGYRILNVFGYTDTDGLEFSLVKGGVKTDIFCFYEGLYDNKMHHSAYKNSGQNRYNKIDYVYDKFELENITFKGHTFNAPSNIEEYITTKYGESWGTPDTRWDWAFSPKNHIKTDIYITLSESEDKFKKWLDSEMI